MSTTRTTLNVEALSFGEKIKIDLDDIDIDSWRRDLWNDRETLRELLDEMRKVTPDRDLKLQALKRLIEDKAANPINPGNRKALIFSAFADTAEYLYRELAPTLSAAGLETALITGGSHAARTTLGSGYDFQQVLTLFSPKSKQRHLTMPKETGELDVLIGTDCHQRGPEPPGLRLRRQLRHPLEPCADHPAFRSHRPHRLDQRADPARELLARHLPRRIHQPQGTRREPHGHRRPRRHRRRQRPHARNQRRGIPEGTAPQAPGRSHRSRRRPHRRVDHRPRPQRFPHGSARLPQGVRRPRQPRRRACTPSSPPTRRRACNPACSSPCATSTPTRPSTAATASTRTTSSTSTTTATSSPTTPRSSTCSTSSARDAVPTTSPSPRSPASSTPPPRRAPRWASTPNCSLRQSVR